MTNIAGQTRDESQSIKCPKCAASMEQVAFGGITVDRCVNCKGLWFDAREQEKLKDIAGAEEIDTGHPGASATARPTTSLICPVCHTPMILMTDHRQPHVKFESCTVCYGAFFDAGEFRDYKEHSLLEALRGMFRRRG
jgi:uncharacterized protein